MYSISAAGVVFAVTEACSRGSLLQCTCDNTIRDISSDGEWVWGGCHDDVDFGYVKSREFMDARRKKRLGDVTTKIQLHNNEAGRLVSNFSRTVSRGPKYCVFAKHSYEFSYTISKKWT